MSWITKRCFQYGITVTLLLYIRYGLQTYSNANIGQNHNSDNSQEMPSSATFQYYNSSLKNLVGNDENSKYTTKYVFCIVTNDGNEILQQNLRDFWRNMKTAILGSEETTNKNLTSGKSMLLFIYSFQNKPKEL